MIYSKNVEQLVLADFSTLCIPRFSDSWVVVLPCCGIWNNFCFRRFKSPSCCWRLKKRNNDCFFSKNSNELHTQGWSEKEINWKETGISSFLFYRRRSLKQQSTSFFYIPNWLEIYYSKKSKWSFLVSGFQIKIWKKCPES